MKNKSGNKMLSALITICVGCGLIAVGFIFGGSKQLGNIAINNPFIHIDADGINMGSKNGSVVGESERSEFSAEKIDHIELEIGAGDVEIIASDVNKIVVDNEGYKVYCSSEGSDFSLSSNGKGVKAGKLTIEVPKNIDLKQFDLSIGASNVVMEGFMMNNFNLECGAGQVTTNNCYVNEADIEIGMGQFTFTGDITGNLTVECGAGEADFYLESDKQAHNYDVEVALGQVQIYDDSINGTGERIENNDADSNFDIECGMGVVSINKKN